MKHPDAKLSLVTAALLGAVLFTAPLAATRCKYVQEEEIRLTLHILYPDQAMTSVLSAPAEVPEANAAPALPGTVESSPAGEALSPDTGTIPEKTGETPLPAGEEEAPDPEEQPPEETKPEKPLEGSSLPPEEESQKGTDSVPEEQPPAESAPALEEQPPEKTTPAPSA